MLNPNEAVITTRFVLDHGSRIVYVVCDNEGEWQFFGKEEVTEMDAQVVLLKNILDFDPSLKDLIERMTQNQEAFLDDTGDSSMWTIRNFKSA